MLRHFLPFVLSGQRLAIACRRSAAAGAALLVLSVPLNSQTVYFSSAQRTVVSGLSSPLGVAVDAAGGLYVTDSGNNRVVKYVLSAGTYVQSVVFDASIPCGPAMPCGLNRPYGVAVDTGGNVYIADLGNNRVVKETPSAGSYIQSTVASANSPNAVAVDTSGNVYIADTGNSRVLVEAPVAGAYTQTAQITGLSSPKGVAVDASGVVYVADTGNHRVLSETQFTLGSYSAATVSTSTAITNYPFGVAIDGGGDVFYSSYRTNITTNQILRAVPAGSSYTIDVIGNTGSGLPFGLAFDPAGSVYVANAAGGNILQLQLSGATFFAQAVGSTSATQTLTFAFTAGGVLGSYAVLTQGAAGLDFADAGGGTCAGGTPYVGSSSCTVKVAFTPRFPGLRQGAVTLKNNSGAVIATAYLQGTGTGPQVAITPGAISTVAGNGTQCPTSTTACGDGEAATGANLFNPAGVVADAANNLYIADADDNRIRKVTPGGTISTVAGTGATGGPLGDGGQAISAQLYYPNGVAIDGAGNLYIADTSHHRVRKVDAATGIITTFAGTGAAGSSGDGGAATSATLTSPYGVAIDGFGNVLIADTYNNKVRKVTTLTGIITTVAGTGVIGGLLGDGGLATSANLSVPYGVTLDSAGNLFIADRGNQRVRKVDSGTGIITTVAGNGTGGFAGDGGAATSAEFYNPYSVAIDDAGNFYIADLNNLRIREVEVATGIITTVAGTGADTSTGDGGVPSAATVGAPASVALDSTGNLYIAEYDAHRIRTITAAAHPLNFANTVIGSTSSDSPQTVTLTNTGNADLTFSVPSSFGNHNPSLSTGFTYGSGSTCYQLDSNSLPLVLAAGVSCTELINFSPYIGGTFNGSSVSTDNTLNVAGTTQSIPLTGTATQGTPTVTVTPASTTYGAATTTLTATVSYAATPATGTVTFALDSGAAVAGSCTAGTYAETCILNANTAAVTTGSHTINVTIAADANYFAASGSAALTVTKTSPVVTAASPSITYGTASATLTAMVTYTGSAAPTGALTFIVDSGTPATATCAGANSPRTCTAAYPTSGLNAGSHTISATQAPDTNYTQVTAGGTLTITQATPIVTAASPSITYGAASANLTANIAFTGTTAPIGALTFAVDSGPPITAACTGANSPLTCTASYTASGLNAGSHVITATEASDTDYAQSSASGTLTIRQARIQVTAASTALTYGGAASTSLTATVVYGGSAAPTGGMTFTVYGESTGPATCTGTSSPLTCTAAFNTSSLGGGTYTIQATEAQDTNYLAASGSGTLTVNPATPTVTAGALSITYGTPLTTLTGTVGYSGAIFPYGSLSIRVDGGAPIYPTYNAPGPPITWTASLPSSTITAGSHTISLSLTADTNYTAASGSSTLTVTQATPVITWPLPPGISYGTTLSTTQLDATANVPGTFTYAPAAGVVLPVGTQTLSVNFVPTDATDYTAATKTLSLTVNPLAPVCTLSVQGTATPLVVVAVTSCTDPQGQSLNPTITWGDGTSTPAATRNAHTYKVAGTYTVTLTATNSFGLRGAAQQQTTPNQLPVCTLGSIQGTSASGESVSLTASCTDPQGQPLTATVDWGDGSGVRAGAANGANAHTYLSPSGFTQYAVSLTATDTSGLSGTATQSVILVPTVSTPPGSPAPVSATVAPQPAYTGPAQVTVTFICSSVLESRSTTTALPSQYGITCSSPTLTVDPSAQIQANVTINSTAATLTASSSFPRGTIALFALLLPFPGLALLNLFSGRRRQRFQVSLLLVLICIGLSSCGGYFTPPPVVATPAGSYAITITEIVLSSPAPTGFVQTSLIVPLTVTK